MALWQAGLIKAKVTMESPPPQIAEPNRQRQLCGVHSVAYVAHKIVSRGPGSRCKSWLTTLTIKYP